MNECLHDNFIFNGEIKKSDEFDEGILNEGRSFYEIIRVIDGSYLFLEDHIARLKNSLKIFNINYSFENKAVIDLLLKYNLNNNISIGNVKLVMSFNETKINKPDILAYFVAHKYPEADNYQHGVDVSILRIERSMPNAKFVNHDVLFAVKKELLNKKVSETLLADSKGNITEGSKSNVFFIKENVIYTSPEHKVLPGITRKHVINIIKQLDIKIIEEDISINNLSAYRTVFMSGTSAKVLPVRRINNIYFDVKNIILRKIMEIYELEIRNYIKKCIKYPR